MFLKKKITLGLDIGHYSAKAAVIQPDGRKILDLFETVLMPDRQDAAQPRDDAKTALLLKSALGKFVDNRSGFIPTVTTAVQGEGTICRYLELPLLKQKELEVAVPAAAMKFVPFPPEEAMITYVGVPPLTGGRDVSAVFFIAAKQEIVKQAREFALTFGISIDHLEIQALALIRAFVANHGKAEGYRAIVQAGSRMSLVMVIREGYVYFIRDFMAGGHDFTYAFQMATQSSWQEAESYKLKYDTRQREVPIEPALTRWMDEVKKSLDYFLKSLRDRESAIEKIHLMGGSACWKGLDARLQEHTGIPVEVEKWNKITPPGQLKNVPPGKYGVALGLTL
jgi:type IV pilus assembly protein PilM